MATQQAILVVCFLHLVYMKPAPLTNTKIDSLQAPVLDTRINLDDRKQNWGILINGSIYPETDDVNYNNRPINIQRIPKSNPILSGEKIGTKLRNDAVTNVKVNDLSRVIYNEPKDLHCDIERIKCCVGLNNCRIGSECLNLDNNFSLCDTKVLREDIIRVMSLF